jgi:hypothetical protein
VINLSEEAKLAYIQERMKETKGNERIASVASMFGMILALVGFMFSDSRFLGTCGIWIGVLGIILAIIEGISYVGNSYQYSKLMQELKAMAKATPTCPKCGKEIPKGSFAFCPFCGSSLTPPPP